MAVVASGGGDVILAGRDTYSGTTTIGSGATLETSGGGWLGGGNYRAATVDNGSLILASSSSQTFSGSINGSGVLFQQSSGTTTLAGNVALGTVFVTRAR